MIGILLHKHFRALAIADYDVQTLLQTVQAASVDTVDSLDGSRCEVVLADAGRGLVSTLLTEVVEAPVGEGHPVSTLSRLVAGTDAQLAVGSHIAVQLVVVVALDDAVVGSSAVAGIVVELNSARSGDFLPEI